MELIDFVIPWVDGSDPVWRKSHDQFAQQEDQDYNPDNIRFRDWGLLRFWFRGVEKYAPWVRKIHFVTCGQVPSWLNLDHPKLHFVKHSDYLPARYLPTFSSRPIELSFHKIDDLAEQFVYFNDDTFLTAPVTPSDFFVKGLPRDYGLRNYIGHYDRTSHNELNAVILINLHLDFHASYRKHIWEWYNYRYGFHALKNLFFFRYKDFIGAKIMHIPTVYLKSTYLEAWRACETVLEETSLRKFRDVRDVNQWLLKYWQLATGRFYPQHLRFGRLVSIHETESIKKCLQNKTYKTICVNDACGCDYDSLKSTVTRLFATYFPEKSSFELDFPREQDTTYWI